MFRKNPAVFGIYPTHERAEAAVETLRTKGFRNTDVSVLFQQNDGAKPLGALAWVAGLGTREVPGIGPFIAAGPFVGALAGLGAGEAIGGSAGALMGLGMPEHLAKRHEGRMRDGGILLSVHADELEWTSKGRQILEQTGAEDMSSVGLMNGDFDNADRPAMTRIVASGEVVKH